MSGRILTRGGGGSFQERDADSGTYGRRVSDPDNDPEVTVLNQHDPSLAAAQPQPAVGVGDGSDSESSGTDLPQSAEGLATEARSGS